MRAHRGFRGASAGALLAMIGAAGSAHAEDTRASCASAYDAALDARHAQRLRASRQFLVQCAQPACPELLREECVRAIRANEDALPSVSIRARDGAGHDLADVRVYMDGELLAQEITGKSIAVDPGMHQFRFEHDLAPIVMDGVLIVEGEKSRILHVEFGPLPGAPASKPSLEKPSPSPTRWPSYVAFGVAGGAIVAGSITGIVTLHEASIVRSRCPNQICPPAFHDDLDATNRWSTVSTVSFIVAGAALGVGVVTWLLSDRKDAPVTASDAACLRSLDLCWRPL